MNPCHGDSALTGSGSLFDADPGAFGAYRVTMAMGQGRFGPVFLADDVDGNRPVVVRVFERIDSDVTDALLEALRLLCGSPLDHPAIARPLACGNHDGLPFLVHTYLPGTPADDVVSRSGRQPLNHVVIAVAKVAAAIDFAAAAGVHHGVLSARDIILNDDGAGVTGFGLVQALRTSGIHVPGAAASLADDIYALAAIAFQLLTGSPYRGVLGQPLEGVEHADVPALRSALASALSIDAEVRPESALEFARALQRAVPIADAVPAAPAATAAIVSRPTDVDVAGTAAAMSLAGAADLAGEIPTSTERTWTFTDVPGAAAMHPDDVAAAPDRLFASPPSSSGRPVLLAVVVALVAAIAGFAGGFTVGQRSGQPAVAAESQPAAAVSPPSGPEDTQGQTFTDAPIDDRAATAPAASTAAPAPTPDKAAQTPANRASARPADKPAALAQAPKPAPRPATPAARTVDRPAPLAGPGSMEVLSRPTGAQVFIDGTLMGRTPLSLAEVEPGAHAVRIVLPGHQRWATSVEVRPRERTRVAASLELVTDPQ